jgi:predicted ester cyclase
LSGITEQSFLAQAIVLALAGPYCWLTTRTEEAIMNTNDARSLIAPFYDALNNPATKDVRALVEGLASPEWRSFSGESVSKGREEFIQQVIGFGKLIPDLSWEIKELFVDGNHVIVRSEARGTPAGDFMACRTAADVSR